jgi:hypothetical protein
VKRGAYHAMNEQIARCIGTTERRRSKGILNPEKVLR